VFNFTQFTKLTSLLLVLCFSIASTIQAEDNKHHHQQNHKGHKMSMTSTPLTEAGNDVFGTIQEAITKLNNDPNTDWSKVNIEALRKHLVDMYEMTINVNVLSQTPIKNGLKVKMQAIGTRASAALKRVFSAHPMMLAQETGWKMDVEKVNEQYVITITTDNSADIEKIRGLGYIGIMAYGNHHQPHHWAMAKGANPHHGHH